MIYFASLHYYDRIAAVEDGVDLPLVLRLFLEFDGGGGGCVAEGGGPEDFEVVEVSGPVAVPVADERPELYGMDFVAAAWWVVVAVSGVVDPRAGDDEQIARVEVGFYE